MRIGTKRHRRRGPHPPGCAGAIALAASLLGSGSDAAAAAPTAPVRAPAPRGELESAATARPHAVEREVPAESGRVVASLAFDAASMRPGDVVRLRLVIERPAPVVVSIEPAVPGLPVPDDEAAGASAVEPEVAAAMTVLGLETPPDRPAPEAGEGRRRLERVWTLSTFRAGAAEIGPVRIVVDGRPIELGPVAIEVVSALADAGGDPRAAPELETAVEVSERSPVPALAVAATALAGALAAAIVIAARRRPAAAVPAWAEATVRLDDLEARRARDGAALDLASWCDGIGAAVRLAVGSADGAIGPGATARELRRLAESGELEGLAADDALRCAGLLETLDRVRFAGRAAATPGAVLDDARLVVEAVRRLEVPDAEARPDGGRGAAARRGSG